MSKRKNKKIKRVRNLIVVCCLWALFLSVSTYAWFIGMKTVNVNPFDIKIATTEGLYLSMDGKEWSYQLDLAPYITAEDQAYAGATNVWAEDGLIPMSTVGDMDAAASRMILFEKGSLTTTAGGYRLLASRVQNMGATEGNGYVAFDLFIKNLSGNEYYKKNDQDNEEAIYLTTNSEVKVAAAGADGGQAGSGIENSVRVAFAQIGRVIATTGTNPDTENTDLAIIRGITCSNNPVAPETPEENIIVTGICRNATIWEPNDTTHVQNAINWYNTSCKVRTGATVADTSYGNDDCQTVLKTNDPEEPTPTYAISRVLSTTDAIDVYDGPRYNTYPDNTTIVDNYPAYVAAIEGAGANLDTVRNSYKLVEVPTFTDTMKKVAGAGRPVFMTLAPNSITKVRVYIYIEGQDIDNYDFASLGAKISVNFGFTKERYNGEDIGYDGPTLPETPTTNPVATE